MALQYDNKAKPRQWYENSNALNEPLNTPKDRQAKEPPMMWVAKNDSRIVTILDQVPTANFHFHVESNNGVYRKVLCIKQHDNCPICDIADQKGRFGYSKGYILLTVIDNTPWTTSDGKVIPYTKKILPIENEMQRKQIKKYFDKYGTTRGLVFEMTRTGTKGEGACGVPSFEEFISEEEIISRYGNKEYKAEDGRVLKEALADTKPFDYGKVYPLPTAAELRSRYNLAAPLGSRADVVETPVESSYEDTEYSSSDLEDDVPFN